MQKVSATRYGPMLVNENDAYVGRSLMEYGEFSRSETEFFEWLLRKGMVVVDVGANIGAHTLAFAKIVGEDGVVFAFEPQRLLFQTLCANMALNGIKNVFAHQVAVGATGGTVKLHEPDYDLPGNFGGVSLESLNGGEVVTPVIPLDIPCHFLKIDVEGMELEVLQGAEQMIRACKPVIYVENDRVNKAEALIAKIRELGYTPRWHITPLFREDNWKGKKENIWDGNVISVNVICVPPGMAGFEVFDEVTNPNHYEYQKEKIHARAQLAVPVE